MPLKVEAAKERSRLPVSRIISIATLLIAVAALVLAMRKPQPVAAPRQREALIASAESLQAKVDQLAAPSIDGQPSEAVHLTSQEIAAAIAQSAGTIPAPGQGSSASATPAQLNDVANALNAADGEPTLGEPVVTFDGDLMKGQFLSELGGKKVYITVTGRLGSKDGYATFDPTEFKVGDLNVPVSLVNDALQKKMTEERDKLKLPDYIGDVKVENGELVITKK
jgi:hypothetical protein